MRDATPRRNRLTRVAAQQVKTERLLSTDEGDAIRVGGEVSSEMPIHQVFDRMPVLRTKPTATHRTMRAQVRLASRDMDEALLWLIDTDIDARPSI
jgi:hypothetical protein